MTWPRSAEPVEVPVTSMRCPCCGGELKWQRTDRVTTTDMPAQPQPEVKVYDVAEIGRTGRGAGDEHALPLLRGRAEMAADRPGDHHGHAGSAPTGSESL